MQFSDDEEQVAYASWTEIELTTVVLSTSIITPWQEEAIETYTQGTVTMNQGHNTQLMHSTWGH
jgi:hypothetical protein